MRPWRSVRESDPTNRRVCSLCGDRAIEAVVVERGGAKPPGDRVVCALCIVALKEAVEDGEAIDR